MNASTRYVEQRADAAAAIVDTILTDLEGRAGIGNALDDIDAEIRQEMRTELIGLVFDDNCWTAL